MKLLFQILLFLLFALQIYAQQAPDFKSLEVKENGDVNLKWNLFPPDPGLQNFEIYFSENGGSFSAIATVSTSVFTYTHNGADADLESNWYFIKANYNTESADSDTLQTIYLQVDNNQPDFNRADLYWNAPAEPIPDGYSSYYKIMREYPLGQWTLHDSVAVDSLHYTEPIIVCHDSINYQIFIEHTSGDSIISNIRGSTFSDEFYPDPLQQDSISVDLNNFVTLGWEPSANGDVIGYIIYLFNETDSDYYNYDTIYGRLNTFYNDSIANPCESSYSFAVAAFDSCFNKGEGTFAPQRFTILLESIDYNTCESNNTLNWSAYNFLGGVDLYNIFFSNDGISYSLAGQTNSAELSFVHENIEAGYTYTYYVQAVFDGRSSSSCKKSITAFAYQLPSFVYFANADVLPTNNIQLTIDVDTSLAYCTWNIYRDDPKHNTIDQVASISGAEINKSPLVVLDDNVDPNLGHYLYFAEVLDSCELLALVSNDNKTIYLTADNSDTDINQLKWSAFEGWETGVEQYFIYRMLNGIEPTSPVDSVSASFLEYADDISSLDNTAGDLVYWVQAVENDGNPFGFKMHANSNRTGVAVASEMFLPNAFRPGGYTPEFKPVYRFYSGFKYLFQIYNRWGQMIFEADDPEIGWDGKHEGNIVSQGVYVYKLVYQNSELNSIEKRGTVTVIY